MVAKATTGHPLAPPLLLVVDKKAPSTPVSHSAASDKQQTKKIPFCSAQCNSSSPLEYLTLKTLRFILCSIPVQKKTLISQNYKHSLFRSLCDGDIHYCLFYFYYFALTPRLILLFSLWLCLHPRIIFWPQWPSCAETVRLNFSMAKSKQLVIVGTKTCTLLAALPSGQGGRPSIGGLGVQSPASAAYPSVLVLNVVCTNI